MENKGIVLLVEDNKDLNAANSRALKMKGYAVVEADTLLDAHSQLELLEPDIILLDVMMPDGNGIDFCKRIRTQTKAHILFLTAMIEHEDIVEGLTSGGDDYITKPFHLEELIARIDAVMRRRKLNKDEMQTLTNGGLAVDIVAARAFFEGEDLSLTPKEVSLLVFFLQNNGKLIQAQQLYEKVWNLSTVADKNAVQTAISKLRQKLEPCGFYIDSIRGQGYILRQK